LRFGVGLQKLDVRSSRGGQIVKVKSRNLEAWMKSPGDKVLLLKEEKMKVP